MPKATGTRKAKTTKAIKAAKPAAVPVRPRWHIILGGLRRNRLAHVGVLWALSFMVLAAYFFSGVLNPSNVVEIFPREFAFPLLLHALTALLVAGVMYAMPRPRAFGPKAVAVVVITLFLADYDARLAAVAPVLKQFVPVLPADPMPILSLILLAVLFAAGIGAGMLLERLKGRYPSFTSSNVLGLACAVVISLFVGQAITLLGVSGDMRTEASHVPATELTQAKAMQPKMPATKPDIYYIVLDRYTNNTVLKEQFGFDNAPFLDGLRSQGFSINDQALSAYPYTAPSIASTLNMSYHNDDTKGLTDNKLQSATLFDNMVEQSQVAKLLKTNGYQYHSLGSVYGMSYNAPLADTDYACTHSIRLFNTVKCLHGVEATQFQKSIFYRFANVAIKGWPLHYTETDDLQHIRDQLATLHSLATSPKQGGRFIFAHILVPHDPFYFLADGSLSPYSQVDQQGMAVKAKYVNQVAFINTQIGQLVSEIRQNSQDKAVIMLLSDEGPYPSAMDQTPLKPIGWDGIGDIVDGSDMTTWAQQELQMKFGVLAAYHIPAATEEDMQNITPPNAFRVVLDRYFGYSYQYLPNCQLGLPNGRTEAYKFKDITGLVTGTDSDSCKQYE